MTLMLMMHKKVGAQTGITYYLLLIMLKHSITFKYLLKIFYDLFNLYIPQRVLLFNLGLPDIRKLT